MPDVQAALQGNEGDDFSDQLALAAERTREAREARGLDPEGTQTPTPARSPWADGARTIGGQVLADELRGGGDPTSVSEAIESGKPRKPEEQIDPSELVLSADGNLTAQDMLDALEEKTDALDAAQEELLEWHAGEELNTFFAQVMQEDEYGNLQTVEDQATIVDAVAALKAAQLEGRIDQEDVEAAVEAAVENLPPSWSADEEQQTAINAARIQAIHQQSNAHFVAAQEQAERERQVAMLPEVAKERTDGVIAEMKQWGRENGWTASQTEAHFQRARQALLQSGTNIDAQMDNPFTDFDPRAYADAIRHADQFFRDAAVAADDDRIRAEVAGAGTTVSEGLTFQSPYGEVPARTPYVPPSTFDSPERANRLAERTAARVRESRQSVGDLKRSILGSEPNDVAAEIARNGGYPERFERADERR
jgi:hypothetical protein